MVRMVISVLVVILLPCLVEAQTRDQVKQIIDVENAFAKLSKKASTKEAFISYLSDNGIVFNEGKAINGKELWGKREPNDFLLFWWPRFADISNRQDLGYTTGPFYVSKDREGKERVAQGYYSSVWKRNDEGIWKVVIDLGITCEKTDTAVSPIHTAAYTQPEVGINKEALLQFDEDYCDVLNERKRTFHRDYFLRSSRIHRNGHQPYVGTKSIRSIKENESYLFELIDGDISASGDLGYTYGNVTLTNKSSGQQQNLNYLRVWRRGRGGSWKIVLDVIGG